MRFTSSVLLAMFIAVAPAACSKQPSSGAPPASSDTPPAPAGQMAPSHAPPGTPPPETPAVQQPVPSTATPIADVWANRKTLAGKVVTVHGKVVKFNGGILGRNWLHIQDGSGKAGDQTNDLTITTTDEAAVGDVITVTGTVGIDRDFTAGYAYPVMLEQARISK